MKIYMPLHRKMIIFLIPATLTVFIVAIGFIIKNARVNTLELMSQLSEESAEKNAVILNEKINADYGDLLESEKQLKNVQNLLDDISVYGNGYSFLLSNNGKILAFPDKNKIGKKFNDEFENADNKYGILNSISLGKKVSYQGIDLLNGKKSFVTYIPIAIGQVKAPLCYAMSVPFSIINDKARGVIIRILLISILGLFLISVLIYFISKNITNPLKKATNVLDKLSKGEIDEAEKLEINTGDEIEDIALLINKLTEGLNRTAEFAKTIGAGNLQAEYKEIGKNDVLGNSLLEMRQSLIVAETEDKKRKIEDDKQNWATQGMAKFGELLRQHNQNITELSFSIMSNLVDYVGAIQGGIFVKYSNNDDEIYFELTGAVAYSRKKTEENKFNIGESLIGRCAHERLTIYMEEIPEDYVNITSGLGESTPTSLLIVPAILNDDVYAIIELVSFNKFEAHQIEFVEKIGESIASTIASSKVNEHTNRLLEQSKTQSEELAAQEEEMRQNMEELQATQEEMSRKEKESKKMIEVMQNKEEKLYQILDEIEVEEGEIKKQIEKIKNL